MNQKLLSVFIGFGLIAIIFGGLIFMQYRGAQKSITKDKFPVVSSDLRDSAKISALFQGLQKHGSLPVSVGKGDKGRDNPFERY